MTMITPSYLGETIEYSSLHACRSTLEDPTVVGDVTPHMGQYFNTLSPCVEEIAFLRSAIPVDLLE